MSDEQEKGTSEGGIGQSASTAGLGAWLPIETAPKDGTPILGFKFGIMPTVLFWLPRSENKTEKTEWWFDPLNPWADIKGITYWIPIPKAPNVQGQGDGQA